MGDTRFRATIRRLGPNPYVDVPARLSRAFAPHARAGRIAVRGALNATPIRATLIPARRGRHRLFVNGGMRAAAGVAVGDTVSLTLRPTRPDAVPLPADLASALRRKRGACAAFGGLTAPHRLQLLRHINDARTPSTRHRRIEEVVAHALASRMPDSGRKPAPGREVPPQAAGRGGVSRAASRKAPPQAAGRYGAVPDAAPSLSTAINGTPAAGTGSPISSPEDPPTSAICSTASARWSSRAAR